MTNPIGPAGLATSALQAERAHALDLTVARLLNVGTLFSVALLALGVILMAVTGQSPLDDRFPSFDLGRLPADLIALRPEGLLWLGLAAVILTPISRVVASLAGYARLADRSMVIISVAILGVIAASVVVSVAVT